ncbi:hypothetical protein [Desulfoluna spongiiphila]|uniref:hypothetical protein n=1 Tax=Desulfoluna spongiiphila TaxID=419481 RepID=UPI001259C953|nr:hypothetical protein [Desulfoluna spongiiphila]VVS92047.1 vitamin b12-dependent methionine synthase activation domain superfamily [Desulfoluna spongiiphila]
MGNTGRILTIDARITPEEVLALAAPAWTSQPDAPAVAGAIAEEMNRIIRPEALFQWFELTEVQAEEIVATEPVSGTTARLTTGGFSPYFQRASRFLAAIYTLGPKVDTLLHRVMAEGLEMEAHFVNMGSLAALTRTASVLTRLAENRAKKEGVGVSPPLSPGSIEGWELESQHELCALFPIDSIGITQGDDAILSPMNTLSVVIAIGPGFTDTRAGSPCRLCRMGGSCTLTCSNHKATLTHRKAG